MLPLEFLDSVLLCGKEFDPAAGSVRKALRETSASQTLHLSVEPSGVCRCETSLNLVGSAMVRILTNPICLDDVQNALGAEKQLGLSISPITTLQNTTSLHAVCTVSRLIARFSPASDHDPSSQFSREAVNVTERWSPTFRPVPASQIRVSPGITTFAKSDCSICTSLT
ncbi:MAG: hypothetical protein RLZZ436_3630 [Planctomycetota bacterium]